MIEVLTNDGSIRQLDRVILDITSAVVQNCDVVITTMSEGPCCQHVGIYDLLDKICAQFNFPKNRVFIRTSNLIETHLEYNIIKDFNFWELERSIDNSKKITATIKNFNKDFKHFGNFIGHSNKYRLQTSSELYAKHQDKTIQSYHCRVTDPYHREYIGIEDLMFIGESQSTVDNAYQHIKRAPIELDTINTFPILQPANINLLKYYSKFFVEIVNLTFFSGNTFYVDEKIWRPMLALTPFMVQGPANLIKNLRQLGFKTFESWWDEGYSEDPDDCQVRCIFENLERLSQLSVQELELMYHDMMPTLVHNKNLLHELTKQKVERVFCI
jgi:hypothetical protein